MRTAFSRNVQENTRLILELYPETRNNYNKLIFAYWVLVDNALPIGYSNKLVSSNNYITLDTSIDAFDKMTSAETITRSARVIQREMGIFLDEETRARRDTMEKLFRHGAVATKYSLLLNPVKGKNLFDFINK